MKAFAPLFQAIIAFCAFFALLSGVIKLFLVPIEKDIVSLKQDVVLLKQDAQELKQSQISIEKKIDQLLKQNKINREVSSK